MRIDNTHQCFGQFAADSTGLTAQIEERHIHGMRASGIGRPRCRSVSNDFRFSCCHPISLKHPMKITVQA